MAAIFGESHTLFASCLSLGPILVLSSRILAYLTAKGKAKQKLSKAIPTQKKKNKGISEKYSEKEKQKAYQKNIQQKKRHWHLSTLRYSICTIFTSLFEILQCRPKATTRRGPPPSSTLVLPSSPSRPAATNKTREISSLQRQSCCRENFLPAQ